MRSMTGFGQAEGENGECRVAVSIRSVNHRFLDLAIRLADEHRELEGELRRLLDDRLARGRVDVRVVIEPLADEEASVALDETVAAGFLAAARRMADLGLAAATVTAGELLRLPEVVRIRRRPRALGQEGRGLVSATLERAVDQLVATREAEGSRLQAILEQRLGLLRELVERLAGARDEVRRGILDRMRARLDELVAGGELPPDRLAQEAALYAEKTDIQEELDRLDAHLESFEKAVRGRRPVGRRLEFLTQEIHRELNTLVSKCRDARMAEWVVDGKVACEQLREQVQNVE